MKKLITILFLTWLLSAVSFAQVKIGLPTGAPQASAILDLSNTGDLTKALVLPRVTNTGSVITPFNGMLIYDLSSNCTKVYDNGAWSSCLSQSASGAGVNCGASALNGNYNQGTALTTANTITIIMINNSATAQTFTLNTTDIALTGIGAAGMSVLSVSPASVTPGVGGGSSTITYTLTGTPTAVGSFTATFTKLGLTCAKTGTVCGTLTPIVVTNTTTPATLPIPTAVGNTINFTAAGGTPNSGITWTMVSNPVTGVFSSPTSGTGTTAQAVLVGNASGLVTVTFTAVNACGLSISGTQGVGVSDLSVNSAASAINGYYSQGNALTAANTVTVVLVNNSTAAKTITPVVGDIVLTGAGAAGITVASVTPTTASVPANGGTGTITYTLSGIPTAVGSFTATWTKLGLSSALTSAACLAIAPITVSNVTNPTTLPGTIVAGNTINFTAAGGTPNTSGMSWTMTSSPATGIFSSPSSGTGNTAQAVLVAGALGTVTVTFSVSNACGLVVTGTQTVSFGDALRNALNAAGCTSCTAYDAAAADTWVNITAAEYAQIDNFITTNIAPLNDASIGTATGPFSANYTVSMNGTSVSTLPANNYVVAFSAINYTGLSSSDAYVKYSTAPFSGFSMGGPALKIPASAGRLYNIMKKPSSVINASSISYIGMFLGTTNNWIGVKTIASITGGYTPGDANSPNGGTSDIPMYQIKGTATKKW